MARLKFIACLFTCINNFETLSSRSVCEFKEKHLKYYKTMACYKSNMPIMASARTSTLQDCVEFARRKKALAFNFSPEEASHYRNFSRNCQVLGCPETANSSTLVEDEVFDYYSAYGNLNMTENSTCIKSVGLFVLIEKEHNYTRSMEKCLKLGGNLANVLSEIRTNHLSQYINDTLPDWYKVAYVGLDDREEEANFRTPNGAMLGCFRYRAWGPGHPRSKDPNEDCVVLDPDRMWRVVKCTVKLPALCEFFPGEPIEEIGSQNSSCRRGGEARSIKKIIPTP